MFEKRSAWLFGVVILCFSVVTLRIAYLGTYGEERLAQSAMRQQNRAVTIAEKRGTIYDRFDRPLTESGTETRALVLPALAENREALYALLRESCGDDGDLYEKVKGERPFVLTVTGEAPAESEGLRLFEVGAEGESYAHHLIGDVGSDGVGRSGLQRVLDNTLREGAGKLQCYVAVDAAQRQLAGVPYRIDYGNYDKKNGVQLTLDREIQGITDRAASQLERGAVVVSDVRTGEILATASRPDYDASRMADYLESENGELVNRALSSYNIGSVFKLVVLAAYTEEHGALPELMVNCTGKITIGDRVFHCHKEAGHGEVDVTAAMAGSCNLYFIELANEVGLSRILDIAERFGIGQSRPLAPGISAARGSLPKREKNPLPGTIANTAIGQGDVMFTPVDAAYLISVIANGGEGASPSLMRGIYRDGGFSKIPAPGRKQVISRRSAELLQQVMIETVENGTGRPAKPKTGGAGGKTATAETGWKRAGETVTQGWFAGFYPARDPRYAIVVVAEGASSGGGSAAPVFREIADGIAELSEAGEEP